VDDEIENRLLTTKQVRSALGNCSEMHVWRLLNDERYAELNFPRHIQIGSRNFWRAREIDAWVEDQSKKPATKRKRPGACEAA
jgi:predicted DNA-binding transcriptional regulator AlpA